MTRRLTLDTLAAGMSPDALARNPVLAANARQDARAGRAPGTVAIVGQGQAAKSLETAIQRKLEAVRLVSVCTNADTPKHGRCPHTGRRYRSQTEARWAAEHPEHRYEAVGIRTAAGVYWADFVTPVHREGNMCEQQALVEVKGAHIRDRSLHKVKAAIRPARAMGFAGIWLAQWDKGRWTVTELNEG